MKIFYAIQATGNGHISRASYLIPFLQKYGKVDTFLSGNNSSLTPDFEVTYRSKGLSLFYNEDGGLDRKAIYNENSLLKAHKQAKALPLEKYDLIINDFDYITARSAKMKGMPSLHFGHQASFKSQKVPRPDKRSVFGEFIFRRFAPSTHHLGLHFLPYDDFILSPIIREDILYADPVKKNHITVYLPSIPSYLMELILKKIKGVQFHIFDIHNKTITKSGNLTLFPINKTMFTESLISSTGIITGAGFETPAEALYLGKNILACPINDHYEQLCNAAALNRLGVDILIDQNPILLQNKIEEWLNRKPLDIELKANNIDLTIEKIISYSTKNKIALV